MLAFYQQLLNSLALYKNIEFSITLYGQDN